ncbi:SEL1-like repeat protein [Nocardia gipuzkoensis]|uniref:SEL1-like repeat protein n=1 Tax=Nocardia gipuzkoensis TaxID=2749991 RepID=UPI003EE20374
MNVGRDFITTYRFSGAPPAATAVALVDLVERRGVGGGLPRATELDPYLLGATPSQFGEPGRCGADDPYVPRLHDDVDFRLARVLTGDRLVLVVGPSKAGKTRSLFEAVRTRLPDARVVVPTPESLSQIPACPEFIDSADTLVVWLENLDRFLTTSQPLTPAVLTRLTSRRARTIVVGTLRSEARYRLRGGSEELAHDTRVLLEQAIHIELAPTSDNPDEHAAAAATYPSLNLDRYGLAEIIAGAPELLKRYDDARYRNPALHTVIQVAVDWVRVGRTDPVPEQTLAELAVTVVENQRPELDISLADIRAAISAARTPPEGIGRVAALLTDRLPDRSRGYRPFDYLVAADDGQHHSPRPIPDDFWHLATVDADVDVLVSTALTAYFRGHLTETEALCHRAAHAGDRNAMFNLGIVLYERGQAEDAETWWRRAADAGDHSAMFNLGVLLYERGQVDDAQNWWWRAARGGDLNAMSNLGVLLRKHGKIDDAQTWYRRAADAGDHSAMFNLGVLLYERGRTDEAQTWWRRAADTGDPNAVFNLGVLLRKRGRIDDAEAAYRRAADNGHIPAMFNLGALLHERGEMDEAAAWYRCAADAGDQSAMFNLGVLLRQQGETEEAAAGHQRTGVVPRRPASHLTGAMATPASWAWQAHKRAQRSKNLAITSSNATSDDNAPATPATRPGEKAPETPER